MSGAVTQYCHKMISWVEALRMSGLSRNAFLARNVTHTLRYYTIYFKNLSSTIGLNLVFS